MIQYEVVFHVHAATDQTDVVRMVSEVIFKKIEAMYADTEAGSAPEKSIFFPPSKLLPTFAETIIHQTGVVVTSFEKGQYGL